MIFLTDTLLCMGMHNCMFHSASWYLCPNMFFLKFGPVLL